MSDVVDAIVIGVGGFGSSALYHLARRGVDVIGIDQFEVAHDRGSSHGETRIIRQAYFEHPDYVPLLKRASELWHALQLESGLQLYEECGLLLAGCPDGEVVHGAKLAARQHDLDIEEVNPAAARQRFRGFRFPRGFAVVHEPQAGFLLVEDCVRAHINQAVSHGAQLRLNENVVSWESDTRTVRVRTERAEYEAAVLVVTAGAWAGRILESLRLPLRVLRKVLLWHRVLNADYHLEHGAGTFFVEMPEGQFYGFPSTDGRVLKIAEHTGGELIDDPAAPDRRLHSGDVGSVATFLAQVMPGVNPQPERHAVCMYTVTPDQHFIVDRHPHFPNVVYGAGFSGHGFKFTSVIGDVLADLATAGRTSRPIAFLAATRPALKSGT